MRSAASVNQGGGQTDQKRSAAEQLGLATLSNAPQKRTFARLVRWDRFHGALLNVFESVGIRKRSKILFPLSAIELFPAALYASGENCSTLRPTKMSFRINPKQT